MKQASDGKPETANTARGLGARPGRGIPVDDDGAVAGGTGGMSVTPDTPANLPDHRRPPEHGGIGKDPIWAISMTDLGDELAYREDPARPGMHGFIEPSQRMSFEDYTAALRATAHAWQLT